MTPHYSDEWLTIYGGDCREVLASLPSDSVDCVVTSPPYWGLRDYGTAAWIGGDAGCDHRPAVTGRAQRSAGGLTGGKAHVDAGTIRPGDCSRCGATRVDSQLGLERTPEEYVANMVAVFTEVRRVLKPSGTCWLNLGNSYTRAQTGNVPQTKWKAIEFPEHSKAGSSDGLVGRSERPGTRAGGLKDKDLVGIPWRVAFALQADGWYLRSDIIWSKPNSMPESVTDRPTKAHEYLFLLTKSARYFFDADAVREANLGPVRAREKGNGESVVDTKMRGHGSHAGTYEAGRNIRSVWTIATRPYPGAHFAVFPPELPERCIKAGSPTLGFVLDPFAGSGTVGMVANRLSRRAILIDLNPEYLKQQMTRNAQTPLGLTEGEPAA